MDEIDKIINKMTNQEMKSLMKYYIDELLICSKDKIKIVYGSISGAASMALFAGELSGEDVSKIYDFRDRVSKVRFKLEI